jgi:hypothetical protein
MAAAHAPLGRLAEARQALAESNRIWPYDTIRTHFPHDLNSRVHATQMRNFRTRLPENTADAQEW